MAEGLFIGFILFLVGSFFYHSYKYHKDGHVSTRDINRYYSESIGLKHKHRSKVPPYDKNGNIYTETKQFCDRAGVYSEEYHKEREELKESIFGK